MFCAGHVLLNMLCTCTQHVSITQRTGLQLAPGVNFAAGPNMATWQGPALLSYNNAVFSPSDFKNISRIGQDSKLERPAATGRFGLGFNAVYHLTDVPSFASGDYIVLFDPHARCHTPVSFLVQLIVTTRTALRLTDNRFAWRATSKAGKPACPYVKACSDVASHPSCVDAGTCPASALPSRA